MKVKLPSALSTSSHLYSFGDATKFPKCCFESYKASHFVTILLWRLLYGSHSYFCCFVEEWERRASGNHIIPLTWLSVPGQDNMSIVQNGGPSNMFCNRSEVKSANLFRQKCYFSQDIQIIYYFIYFCRNCGNVFRDCYCHLFCDTIHNWHHKQIYWLRRICAW